MLNTSSNLSLFNKQFAKSALVRVFSDEIPKKIVAKI